MLPIDQPLELDDYEAINLHWLLTLARKLGLDTGDWLGQIKHKLEARGFGYMSSPNASPMLTKHLVKGIAVKAAQYLENE